MTAAPTHTDPPESPAYLGVDLGTSALKLTLLGPDGAVVAEAEESYDVRAPRPGHAETQPEEWARALRRAGARLGAFSVAAIGFAGQMHGVVLAGPDGSPIRPALLWPDHRSADLLPAWQGLPAPVRDRLGNPLVAGMAGPMVSWLSRHEPGAVAAASAVLSPKDWLRHTFTGTVETERSDASATLLWDVVADAWSTEAVALAGIAPELLPRCVASDAVVGATSGEALGQAFTRPVPVVAGAADTAAALVALEASGAVQSWSDGAVVVNAGTGIQVIRPGARPSPRRDPVTHMYADAADGWYEMLAVQNGGLALTWAQRALGASWEEAVALARTTTPGARGALFVPFLTGERGGVAPPGATGSWNRLTPSTGRPELIRAAFEAYAFTVRRAVSLVGASAGPVLLSGGGGREPWVRQLLADVLGRPVTYVPMRSASAVGAALLAARGLGHRLTVPTPTVETEPQEGSHREVLDAAYDAWLAVIGRTGR